MLEDLEDMPCEVEIKDNGNGQKSDVFKSEVKWFRYRRTQSAQFSESVLKHSLFLFPACILISEKNVLGARNHRPILRVMAQNSESISEIHSSHQSN